MPSADTLIYHNAYLYDTSIQDLGPATTPGNACLGSAGTYYVGSRRSSNTIPAEDAVNAWGPGVGSEWPHGHQYTENSIPPSSRISTADSFDVAPTLVTDSQDEVMSYISTDTMDVGLTSNAPIMYSDSIISNYESYPDDMSEVQCVVPLMLQKGGYTDSLSPRDMRATFDPSIVGSSYENHDRESNREKPQEDDKEAQCVTASNLVPRNPPSSAHSLHKSLQTIVSPLTEISSQEARYRIRSGHQNWLLISKSHNKNRKEKEILRFHKQSKDTSRTIVLASSTMSRRRDRPKHGCLEHPSKVLKNRSALRKQIATTHSRPFACVFSFANCRHEFVSKNEWKRHVDSQHLRTKAWLCDHEACRERRAVFNRKDLFGCHLRRMHGPKYTPEDMKVDIQKREEMDEYKCSIPNIQKRCFKIRWNPPEKSKCIFCDKEFIGKDSWDSRMEHIGKHYENAASGCSNGLGRGSRRNGSSNHPKPIELPPAKVDEWLVEWALTCGILREVSVGPMCDTIYNNEDDTEEMEGLAINRQTNDTTITSHAQKRYRLVENPWDPLVDGPVPFSPTTASDIVDDYYDGDDDDDENEFDENGEYIYHHDRSLASHSKKRSYLRLEDLTGKNVENNIDPDLMTMDPGEDAVHDIDHMMGHDHTNEEACQWSIRHM